MKNILNNLLKFIKNSSLVYVLLAIFFCLLCPGILVARHITGGDLTYKYYKGNQFILKFTFYRDCAGTGPNLPDNITYKIFLGSNKSTTYQTNTIWRYGYPSTPPKVQPSAIGCATPTSFCIQEGLYYDTVTLGSDTVGYHVEFEANQRSTSITNLDGSATYFGSVWYCFIPPVKYKNSSPQFLTTPLPLLCSKTSTIFNQNCYDPDNDSLVFTSEIPWSAGTGNPPPPSPPPFNNCTYASGYSKSSPFGSSGSFTIDSTTGQINAKTGGTGQFVIAISIKEYRYDPVYGKSVFMGEVRRDYDFFAVTCTTKGYGAPIYFSDPKGYTRYVDPDSTICFNVSGYSKSPSDSIYLWATSNVFKGAANSKAPYATFQSDTAAPKDTVFSTFCWTPSCDQVTYTSPYIVTFYLSDASCNISNLQYKIYVTPRPLYKGPVMRCADIVSNTSIKLSFTPVTSTKAGTFKQYYIYRKKGAKGTYGIIDSITTISTSSYTDNSVTNTSTDTYYYYIRSQNTCNYEGLPSDTMTSMIITYKYTGDKSVRFGWPKHRNYGSFYYRIYQDAGSGYKLTDSTKNNYYNVASCSKNFNFKVTVYNGPTACTSTSSVITGISLKDVTAPNLKNIYNVTTVNQNTINLSFFGSDSNDTRSYQIYRQNNTGTSSLLDSVKHVKGQTKYTYTDTKGLSTYSSQYRYKIKATDTCGNVTSYSSIFSPSLLTGTQGQLRSNLTWTKFIGYTYDSVEVQRSLGTTWSTIYRTNLTDTTFTDTNIICSIKYYYRIIHRENGGNNQYSYSDSIMVIGKDTVSPKQVDLLSVNVVSSTTLVVGYDKSAAPDVKRYYIYLSTNNKPYKLVQNYQPTGTPPYTYSITGLKLQDSVYNVQVKAADSCTPNISPTTETHKPVLLKGTPGPLQASLNWNKYVGFGTVKNYLLQRKAGALWNTVATLTASDSTYTETGLSCGVLYTYRIIINESLGSYQVSNSNETFVTPYDTVSPPKVNTYCATVTSPTTVEFAFDKVSSAPRVKYIEVYMKTPNGAYTKILSVLNTFTGTYKLKVTGLNTLDSSYSFRAYALDSCGGSKSKFYNTHKTILLKGTAANQSNHIYWTRYTGFNVLKNYQVQRKTTGSWATIATLSNTDSSYADTPIGCYIKYHYRIVAVENGGNNSQAVSDSINLTPFDTIRPDKPVIKYVTMSNDSTAYIAWAHTKAPDVKKYNLYRKPSSGSTFTKIATVNIDTFYADKISGYPESYCYMVEAVDSCSGNISPKSNTHCTEFLQTFTHGCIQKVSLHWNKYSWWTPGVMKYKIYRKINSGTEAHLATVASSLDSFVDNNSIDYHNTYYYRIAALNNSDSTITSFSQRVKVNSAKPETPYIKFASKISTSATTGQIVIKWNKQSYPTRYIQTHSLYWRKAGTTSWAVLSSNMPVSKDSFIHSGLNTASSNYEYKMIATDSCGNVSDTSGIHRTSAFNMTVGQLTHRLYWTPYKNSKLKEYQIFFLSGTKWTVVDTVLAIDTHLIRIPVACNKTVYYKIGAVDSFGNTAFSDTAGGQAIDIILPNPPDIKNATVLSGTKAQIDFRGSDSLDMYSYAIQRSTNGSWATAGSLLFTTPGAMMKYVDAVNTLNDYHGYVVIALDSCLNASPSDTFYTYQLMGKAQQLSNRISWNPFKGYNIDSNIIQTYTGGTWKTLKALKPSDSFYIHTPLVCGKSVTYRIFAREKSGANTTLSDSITLTPFDTVRPTPVVINYASVLNGNSIYVSWAKSSADVKTYDVEMKTTSGAWKKIATTTSLFTTATLLNTKDSTYSFRVFAYDTCALNKSLPGVTHTVVQLTGTPKNLSNDLTWSAYAGFSSVNRYIIYRWSSGGWLKKDSVAGSLTTYTDKPLACNVKQYYKVGAVDNSGKFLSYSDSISLTPFDTIKPNAPQLNYVSVNSTKQVKVVFNWDPGTDIKYYDVYRQTNGLGTYIKVGRVTYDSVYLDTVSNAHANRYSYYTIAVDSCSVLNRSLPSDSDITITAKTYTGGCKPYVTVYWNSYNDFAKKVDKYVIWKSIAGGTYTAIKTVSAPQIYYTDSSVIENISYCYRVQAVDNQSGFSSYSDTFCSIPFIYPRPKTITMKKVSVTKSDFSYGEIQVDWNRLQKGDTFTRAYRVYHATKANGPFSVVRYETDTNITSFRHGNLNTVSQEHYYYVVTVNKCNLESFIAPADTHKAVLLTITNNNLSADLKFTKYLGYKVARYEVYKSTNKSAYGKLADINSTDSTFTDNAIRCGLTYTYKVVAVETGTFGRTSNSDSVSIIGQDNTPPTRAKMIMGSVASTSKTTGEITLQFTTATEANRKGYEIYRSVNGGAFSHLITIIDTNFSILAKDKNLNTYDNTYSYFVQTFDSCGNTQIPSDTHSVNNLTALATNGSNVLNWTGYVGWKNYLYIVQRRTSTTGWNTLDTLISTNTGYQDSLTTCHIRYTYRIATWDVASGSISYSDEDTATAFESNPPQRSVLKYITVTKTDLMRGKIELNYTTSHSRDVAGYIIQRKPEGSKNWYPIANVKDTVYTDSSIINTKYVTYQYKITTIDSCGNINKDDADVHRSMNLRQTAGNSEMDLIWNKYQGFPVLKYVLYKDGVRLRDIPNTDTIWIDTLMYCHDVYDYTVHALNANDTFTYSVSNIDSALVIDHKAPRPVYLSTVSVDTPNNVVLIRWKKSYEYDAYGYRIIRKDKDIGTPHLIDSVFNLNDTVYIDHIDATQKDYCYEVRVIDRCYNQSMKANMGCIMHTEGKAVHQLNTVTWNPYKEWRWGIDRYNIYKRNDSAQWQLIGTVGNGTTTFEDRNLDDTVKDFCYRIEAIEKDGTNASSYSTEVCLQQPAVIFMPNAFTPLLSPTLNDVFKPGGAYFADFEMKIFNRWGQLIYYTNKGEGWDGKYMGSFVPDGVYIYKVKVRAYDLQEYNYEGVLHIIK